MGAWGVPSKTPARIANRCGLHWGLHVGFAPKAALASGPGKIFIYSAGVGEWPVDCRPLKLRCWRASSEAALVGLLPALRVQRDTCECCRAAN